MASPQLDKIFPCLTCKNEIRLARNDSNNGWIKYNLDGSLHVDEKKNSENSSSLQIAELTSVITQLRSEMKIVIAQLQGLRSDIKGLKAK